MNAAGVVPAPANKIVAGQWENVIFRRKSNTGDTANDMIINPDTPYAITLVMSTISKFFIIYYNFLKINII